METDLFCHGLKTQPIYPCSIYNTPEIKPPLGMVPQGKTFVWLVRYGFYFLYAVPGCMGRTEQTKPVYPSPAGLHKLQTLSIFPPREMLETFPGLR